MIKLATPVSHLFENKEYEKSIVEYSDLLECRDRSIDYDNHIIRSIATGGITAGNPVYYNRGAGNIGPETIVCGNIDSELYNDGENFSTTISTNCTIVAMVAINMINDKKLKS